VAIPDYQTVMLPLLELTADGKEHRIREAVSALADHFGLSDAERKEALPSGPMIFDNRVRWAQTSLKHAGFLRYPQRAHIQITEQGQIVLSQKPAKIDVTFLRQFPKFLEFQSPKKSDEAESVSEPPQESRQTPEELMEWGYSELRKQLESELLDRVKLKADTPEFLEHLVKELLTQMGYGGSLADAGEVTGKSGDAGIDVVIREDKLGLDLLLVQVKNWGSTTVGRPEIQKFVGALAGRKAKKGVFITTSTFTKEAREYAESIDSRVKLIDGAQLAELMFDYGIGATERYSYIVKRIDSDFFEDDEIGGATAAETAAQ